ncbi:MAG TPA: putative DNA-binding domain-containing protein [Candidatus Melainabacteria bacterium]|nr:putative DNA-binding domain-containing protein [Candidatus Melainabacteria bacterium]
MSSLHEIEKTLTSIWMDRQPPESAQSLSCLIDKEEFDIDGAKLYARLIGYGHSDVLTSIYPYCAQILGNSWEKLIKQYVKVFPPDHFHLNTSAKRFPQFIREHCADLLAKRPYLAELADYEWLEMELLEVDTTIDTTARTPLSDPQAFVTLGPLLNSTLAVHTYTYPIQQIVDLLDEGKGTRKKFTPEPSHVAMYRDPYSHKVRIVELDENARFLLSEAATCSYGDLAKRCVELNPERDPQSTVADVIELIEQFHEINLFVGDRKIGK